MDLMNRVFKEYLYYFFIMFKDDILVYYKTQEEHEEHLHLTLQRLREHQLYVKYKKCEFWLSEVAILGHIVTNVGIKIDPITVAAMKEWPRTKNACEIRSILGSPGYYKRFVEGFSKITRPLTELTRKNLKKIIPPDKCEQSFQELKSRLILAPVLNLPSDEGQFVVSCDASKQGLGYVLM
ncbi:uncharacterized mitochondrial protein AtMg00860-like [Humulus lupulus]|uniref:uncharacterized mitochondrial protein AtMg00860-like n=1 Tax=Humulus lupulus TaxID=3486 RepID=UPI002B402FF1|nr:uncharacterized mitochondrial protein AtMg00860-like [Humulus lupulus]